MAVLRPERDDCPHRFYRAYDDGDGRWDYLCLECDHWPDWDELAACRSNEANLEDGRPWITQYLLNVHLNDRW